MNIILTLSIRSKSHLVELTHLSSVMVFRSNTKVMAPKKGPKKSEDTTEISSPEEDVISDTTPHAIDSIKSWRQINENLDCEMKNSPSNSEKSPSGHSRIRTSQNCNTPTAHGVQRHDQLGFGQG